MELSLAGAPDRIAGRLETIHGLGNSVEVHRDEGAGEDASRVRILVDDADAELPRILKALDGADVRSADLPKASSDEVCFRLVRGPQAMDPDRAVG